MPNPKRKSPKPARIPRARDAHSRQRQRLIDACISALHIYGPSRTTVEKVVAIAKMSPGIVRFYFASKAAMLVASLQFLSAEFEEQLMAPVTRLKSSPVQALELMVDLYRVHGRNTTIFADRRTRALRPWCASSSSG
jgi:AcrR family transcriptional regulator